jgi:S1-C subfamily serine protease
MREKKNILEPEISPVEPVVSAQEAFYKTGNTTPPRERLGFLIFLILACIFIGGVSAAAAMLSLGEQREDSVNHGILQLGGNKAASPYVPATEPKQEPSEERKNDDQVQITIADTKRSGENVMQTGGLSLQEIYDKVNPSVVSVTVENDGASGFGTGIVLTEDGYLITSAHIISGADAVSVTFSSGASADALIVGEDAVSDLAVLKVEAQGLTPAEFGNADMLQVGDGVLTIGNPLGDTSAATLTQGIVCAISQGMQIGGKPVKLLQTNAILSDGNSGGPLVNGDGQVVGILSMRLGSTAEGVSLGYAVPTSFGKEIVESIINLGYVPGRPVLPLEMEEMPAITRAYYRLPEGLYISAVEQSSELWERGVRPGDMLLALDDVAVTSQQTLTKLLSGYSVGDSVIATFYHQGTNYVLELTLTEFTLAGSS